MLSKQCQQSSVASSTFCDYYFDRSRFANEIKPSANISRFPACRAVFAKCPTPGGCVSLRRPLRPEVLPRLTVGYYGWTLSPGDAAQRTHGEYALDAPRSSVGSRFEAGAVGNILRARHLKLSLRITRPSLSGPLYQVLSVAPREFNWSPRDMSGDARRLEGGFAVHVSPSGTGREDRPFGWMNRCGRFTHARPEAKCVTWPLKVSSDLGQDYALRRSVCFDCNSYRAYFDICRVATRRFK